MLVHQEIMRIFKSIIVFCLAVADLVSVANAGTYCKNDEGVDVAWFFLYKLPYRATDTKGRVYSGREYLYVDNNTESAQYWTLSSKEITDSVNKGALANTIALLTAQDKPKDLTYAVYNDNEEVQARNTYGHTKGLFMFDNETGVWLIHSVTKFPKTFNGYQYPLKEKCNKGQTVLCVTFNSNQLETIADQLLLQHPNIYAKNSSLDWYGSANLEALLNNEAITSGPWERQADLYDVAGNKYQSFATRTIPESEERQQLQRITTVDASVHKRDVYSAIVAPKLKSDLLVSTWLNGRGAKLGDFHGKYNVKDVQMLNFKLSDDNSIEVENTVDHSKWAISEGNETPHVCVGSLNRMRYKITRGGETLCFENTVLHTLLNASIHRFDRFARKRPTDDHTEKKIWIRKDDVTIG